MYNIICKVKKNDNKKRYFMTVFDFLEVFDLDDDFLISIIESDSSDFLYQNTYKGWLADYQDKIRMVETQKILNAKFSTATRGIIIYV